MPKDKVKAMEGGDTPGDGKGTPRNAEDSPYVEPPDPNAWGPDDGPRPWSCSVCEAAAAELIDGRCSVCGDHGGPTVDPVAEGVMWLDPQIINWPANRMTSEHGAESAAALAASMEEAQEEPVGVVLLEDGTLEGASGMNRCRAAAAAGNKVLCHVRRGTHRDVVRANIATATNQGTTNPRTEVEAITHAIMEEGWTVQDMIQTTGKSQAWVEDRLLIAKASPVVLQYLGEMRIGIGHANLIAKLDQHADQEEVMHKQLQHNWSVTALEKYLGRGTSSAEPATQKLGSCGYCNKQIEAPADRVQLIACGECAEVVGPGKSTATLEDGTVVSFALPVEIGQSILARLISDSAPEAEYLADLMERIGIPIQKTEETPA